MSKQNNDPILIPHIDLPFHWSQAVSHVEVWLTLSEAEEIMKDLGAGTHLWAEPTNYNCAETVLSFLSKNMVLAQEIRLTALGLYNQSTQAA